MEVNTAARCMGASPPTCLRARAAAVAAWLPSSSAIARTVLAALELPSTPATFAPARALPQAELWFDDAS
jgi:hypothetical protein